MPPRFYHTHIAMAAFAGENAREVAPEPALQDFPGCAIGVCPFSKAVTK